MVNHFLEVMSHDKNEFLLFKNHFEYINMS